MSCSALFWLYSLGSLLIGGLVTWLFLRNRMDDLRNEISRGKDKVLNLENEYSSLRASSQEQILALKEEKQSLLAAPVPATVSSDLSKKYDKLKIENQNLQSQIHQLKRVGTSKDPKVQVSKETEALRRNLSKAQIKIDGLDKEKSSLLKENKRYQKLIGEHKKAEKTIKKLEKEVKSLKDKLKKKKDPESVEKRVEIIKSLRTKKLRDWLKRDKAYKVSKKVSTNKIKEKS